MGNWNRRYMPRRRSRQYEYEDPLLSAPIPYNNQSYSSVGVADNRVLSWEIDYCNSVRVPWYKVLASKKYIYGYPSVLNWDDSAGKEAFENAKQRFWAAINGLPCDNLLPDSDIYIDEIDWNPHMDPELMADLDCQVFNPDEGQNVEKLETISEGIEGAHNAQCDINQHTSANPWEIHHGQGTGSVKDVAQGWGTWGDEVNLNNGNPWEQSCSQVVDSSKDNGWSGNESWGWHQGIDNTRSSHFVDNGCGNSCNLNGQNVATRQERWGWGQRHGENNSWGWSQNVNAGGPINCGYSIENNYPAGSKDRGWRENRNESQGWSDNRNESRGWRDNRNESQGWRDNRNESRGWRDNRNESRGWKDAEYQGNEPKYWDSRNSMRGGRSFRGGWRKRESSVQHISKYKSSRHHGDAYGDSHRL